jgi:hypothetical protein
MRQIRVIIDGILKNCQHAVFRLIAAPNSLMAAPERKPVDVQPDFRHTQCFRDPHGDRIPARAAGGSCLLVHRFEFRTRVADSGLAMTRCVILQKERRGTKRQMVVSTHSHRGFSQRMARHAVVSAFIWSHSIERQRRNGTRNQCLRPRANFLGFTTRAGRFRPQ